MTGLLAIAVAVGVVSGLAGGGHLSGLLRSRVGWGWLLLGGAALQALVLGGTLPLHGHAELAAVLVSYAALAGFAVLNLGRPGMGVLLVGVLLNAGPIAVNRGMPVERRAILSAGVAGAADIPLLDFGGKRHLATPADHLRAFDDAIPDWISHQVLSVGDLVITLGVAAVVAGLLDPRPRGRRRRRAAEPAAVPNQPAGVVGRSATGRREGSSSQRLSAWRVAFTAAVSAVSPTLTPRRSPSSPRR